MSNVTQQRRQVEQQPGAPETATKSIRWHGSVTGTMCVLFFLLTFPPVVCVATADSLGAQTTPVPWEVILFMGVMWALSLFAHLVNVSSPK